MKSASEIKLNAALEAAERVEELPPLDLIPGGDICVEELPDHGIRPNTVIHDKIRSNVLYSWDAGRVEDGIVIKVVTDEQRLTEAGIRLGKIKSEEQILGLYNLVPEIWEDSGEKKIIYRERLLKYFIALTTKLNEALKALQE